MRINQVAKRSGPQAKPGFAVFAPPWQYTRNAEQILHNRPAPGSPDIRSTTRRADELPGWYLPSPSERIGQEGSHPQEEVLPATRYNSAEDRTCRNIQWSTPVRGSPRNCRPSRLGRTNSLGTSSPRDFQSTPQSVRKR